MKTLIKSGRVIDPANNLDMVADILIEDNKIALIDERIEVDAEHKIDASGKIVIPGLVDMHVHLREPGREEKETILSGTTAALAGGVTSLLAMPNTEPAIDSAQNVRLLQEIINKDARSAVFIAGAITKERAGKELSDIAVLKKEGVLAITDDGSSVDSDALMLAAFRRAKKEGLLVICHSEDKTLSNNGVMNLGFVSTRLGLRGIPAESEYKRVERDLRLAEKAHALVHIAHVSTRRSVEIVALAKKKGLRVSAETCPHYFMLTEDAVAGYDTNMKMNPPLRTGDDVAAIKEGLRDGTIDVISSDHAPHTENEKEIEFARAEFGVTGLETELACAITELIGKGVLSWGELVAKMAMNPSRILGLQKGSLGIGCDADLAIIAPDDAWQVKKEELLSKSKNSAFLGRRLQGRVECTVYNGRIAYKRS